MGRKDFTSLLSAVCRRKPACLAQRLAEDQSGGNSYVERSQTGLHWYPYTGIGGRVDHIRYAGAFPAEQ